MLLWMLPVLLDSPVPAAPVSSGCLFVPSGSDRLITSDGDVFHVVCVAPPPSAVTALQRHRHKVKAAIAWWRA